MAKIITVHGTGATGPEEGDRWWQRGSLFETHIRQLVEGEDGALIFEPFIWDGANSEESRRSAGRQLLGALLKLETSAQDHCLIGHSHGGSVISHALLTAAAKRADLPHLKTWITIGTPFIKLKRRFLLFSRVNFFGKAAIITAITHLLIYPLLFPLALTGYAIWTWPLSYLLDTLWSTTPFWLILLPPYALIYAGISYLNIRSMKAYSKRARSNFDSQFSTSWLGLWHRSDEAIYGLRSIRNVRHRFFLHALLFLRSSVCRCSSSQSSS